MFNFVETVSGGVSGGSHWGSGNESLVSRARATIQDPVFQEIKVQFTSDFDFNVPGATKLHNLIGKLRKWITILESKVKTLPK